MRNKTLATWLALLGGPLGLHRFYLKGRTDLLGWLLPIPTLLGLLGVVRVRQFGVDDHWSWILIPPLGFVIAACALTAIVYGLTAPERWNSKFNPLAPEQAASGATNWLTVGAVVLSLLLGTTALMSSLAFSFQRYFEYQVNPAPNPTV